MANRAEAFVLEVFACAGTVSPRREAPRVLAPVLDHVHRHLGDPMPVPELAARAGLSVGCFKARFKQETGLPPGEFVLRAKIEEASRRLERGRDDITTIAYDLGFSSSQYFATVFKRLTGQTASMRRDSKGKGAVSAK